MNRKHCGKNAILLNVSTCNFYHNVCKYRHLKMPQNTSACCVGLGCYRYAKLKYEPSREKTNSFASAKCIDPDQTAQSAQNDPGRHIPSHGDRGIEQ